MVDKVIEFLREYQYLFPTMFTNLKVIIGDLGVMKITFKPDAKPLSKDLTVTIRSIRRSST